MIHGVLVLVLRVATHHGRQHRCASAHRSVHASWCVGVWCRGTMHGGWVGVVPDIETCTQGGALLPPAREPRSGESTDTLALVAHLVRGSQVAEIFSFRWINRNRNHMINSVRQRIMVM